MNKFRSLFLALCLASTALMHAQEVKVNATAKGAKFDHFWSKSVGAGRANEGLRAGWLEQLQQVQKDCGFQYVRFHGLFHDDMFPVLIEKGKTVYNWQYIDDLFDRMLDMKVKPFVELAFFPTSIAAKDSKTVFWWKANVTPAEDSFEKWHDLVKAFTQHCVDRYGTEEVLTWYFEVWNEPNLYPFFWDGKKSQYYELYKQSALAVKSVDKRFKIGGPATSNFVPDTRFDGEIEDKKASEELFKTKDINTLKWHAVWVEDFLKYCDREKLPVDFISCHPYPTDYALDASTGRGRGLTRYVNSTKEDLEWLNKMVAKSAYPNAELHLTEWSTSPSSRDRAHDLLPAAAYIVKANLDCIGLTHSLSYWTFTDIFEEKGGASSIFHGGFGMINFQGLVKPSYHAYAMLHQLGNEQLFKNDNLFVSRQAATGKIVALAYNYPDESKSAVPSGYKSYADLSKGSSKKINIKLSNLKPGTQFQMELLDKDHGNIVNYWENMGKPEPPTRVQIKELKKVAMDLKTELVQADKNGNLIIQQTLAPWSVLLIKQIDSL
ncbi:GH39 family glycosyl hydrolase [Flavobacterium fluviatile]|uniref:GH39 family glycosyl hydrolase n=1 Tax=Flavobacterium fluviatile TaxID=1862387 RepID=UPI0013D61B53|nr:glycoside hydrolase [Flavobacterium fluviatile]